jgi:hypothetical protein
MALASYWPATGLLVPFPGPADAPLASSGAQAEPTDYLTNLVRGGQLLTRNPDGSSTPAPVDYFQYAIYCTSLASLTGVFGGQVVRAIAYDSTVRTTGGGDFYWSPTSTATVNGGTVLGSGTTGRWLRSYSGPAYSSWFGTYGDNSHDDIAALDAFYAAIPQGGEGRLDLGIHRISRPWTMATAQTTVRACTNLFGSSGGACIYWNGTATNTCAVRMVAYGQHLEGVLVASVAATSLLGGVLCGNTTASPLQTHNTITNCSVAGGAATTDSVICFGFMVGADPAQSGNGQDFNNFQNCYVSNVQFAGFYIGQSGNTIQTKLTRCQAVNYLGWVGNKRYAALGLSDGVAHPYGIGVWADRCNSVILEDFTGSSLETIYKRTGSGFEYDRITAIDAENCKKLIVTSCPYLLSPISIQGGRIVGIGIKQSSVGPDGSGASYGVTGGTPGAGYLSTDVVTVDTTGTNLRLESLSINYGDNNLTRIDGCIRAGTQSAITVMNCLLPSCTPFAQSADQPIVSWGNFGSAGIVGTPTRVLDGVYRINSGGHAMVPVHFDSVQIYTQPTLIAQTADLISAAGPTQKTPRNNNSGTFTISGTSTLSGSIALPIQEVDTTYTVVIQPVSITGAPAAGAYVAVLLEGDGAHPKTINSFYAATPTAPGAGTSVTYRWFTINGGGP